MQDQTPDAPTAPIVVSWTGPDGRRQPLGEGRIDAGGVISIDAPRPGMADYLAEALGPLNARAEVVVKEPWPGEPGALHHRRVPRHAPAFLAELKTYALRTLGLELSFDETVFAPPVAAPMPLAAGDAPSPTAIAPLPDDHGGIDLDAYAETAPEEEDHDDAPFEPLSLPRFGAD